MHSIVRRSGTVALIPAMSDDLSLAAEFPAASEQDWRKLVEAALKGADFDKRLVSRTYDGLRVDPLYPRAHGAAPVAGRPATPWLVAQRVDHPDPAEANKQALVDLESGATGLALAFAGAPAARGYGLAAETADALEQALSGVMLDLIAVRIETAPFAGRPMAMLMTEVVAKRKTDPASLDIDFGLDPLGDMARTGRALLPWPELSARAGGTAKDLAAKGFAKARFLRADGRAVHEAGGSEAQELAFVYRGGRRLSALVGGERLPARRGAAAAVVPARRRCRRVSHHRQVPRTAEAVGARRTGKRPDAASRPLSPPRPPGG